MPRKRPRAKPVPLSNIQPHEPVLIVEIERATPVKPRRAVEYSPINSVSATPVNVEDIVGRKRVEEEEEIEAAPEESGPWTAAEQAALEKLLTNRRTLAIHWDLIAISLAQITGIKRSQAECEEQHVEALAREYANSARPRANLKKRAQVETGKSVITPSDEFKARDPTRRFKMTKLLSERTFKDRPASFISPQPGGLKARRYSFINDTLSTDFGVVTCKNDEGKRSALSFLKEVLPEREDRASLNLDDDRFMQKLKGAASKSGKAAATAPHAKRRLQHNATINNLVSGLAAKTDIENEQCLTETGLNEELVALSHKDDEYRLLLDEMENVTDNTIIH